MVAGRYLRSKRREGFISVIAGFSFLGILLGVATLIIVMSVMNGFREELVGRILGLNGHINVYSKSGPMFPFEPVIERLKKIDGVTRAVATVEGQVLLSVEGNASGAVVRGLSVEDFNNKPILSTSLIEKLPNIPTFGDDYVSIGKTMAEKFGLHVGDKLVLISPKGRASPFGTVPRSRAFIVGSVFDVGMYEYNSSFIFMSLNMAQLFFDMGEGVSAVEIMTPNLKTFQQTETAIQNELQGQYSISDWQDSNASFYNALQVERNVMFLILTLIVVVAAFNIISSLIMLVKDKGQDIAILRTMGATRGMIIRIFFYTGATIGTVGTLAGALFGVVFCKNIESIRHVLESLTHTNLFSAEIYFLTKLPAKLDVTEVLLIVGMALFLSFAATIYPAWRAAKLDPVEALRRE
jgi:lipoprotein-releasing system permease protein